MRVALNKKHLFSLGYRFPQHYCILLSVTIPPTWCCLLLFLTLSCPCFLSPSFLPSLLYTVIHVSYWALRPLSPSGTPPAPIVLFENNCGPLVKTSTSGVSGVGSSDGVKDVSLNKLDTSATYLYLTKNYISFPSYHSQLLFINNTPEVARLR